MTSPDRLRRSVCSNGVPRCEAEGSILRPKAQYVEAKGSSFANLIYKTIQHHTIPYMVCNDGACSMPAIPRVFARSVNNESNPSCRRDRAALETMLGDTTHTHHTRTHQTHKHHTHTTHTHHTPLSHTLTTHTHYTHTPYTHTTHTHHTHTPLSHTTHTHTTHTTHTPHITHHTTSHTTSHHITPHHTTSQRK
jgi:hypothetical protein